MKKGLWSPEEDEKLKKTIATHKNGSWSDIARSAGLQRCGKSCRRRWLNHLRPGLKRGKFTQEEIRMVVNLHNNYGNKWSEIAAHLVGRTDNDVKNLWNTQIKRQTRRQQNITNVEICQSITKENNSIENDMEKLQQILQCSSSSVSKSIDNCEFSSSISSRDYPIVENKSCDSGSSHSSLGSSYNEGVQTTNLDMEMMQDNMLLHDHTLLAAPQLGLDQIEEIIKMSNLSTNYHNMNHEVTINRSISDNDSRNFSNNCRAPLGEQTLQSVVVGVNEGEYCPTENSIYWTYNISTTDDWHHETLLDQYVPNMHMV